MQEITPTVVLLTDSRPHVLPLLANCARVASKIKLTSPIPVIVLLADSRPIVFPLLANCARVAAKIKLWAWVVQFCFCQTKKEVR